MYFGIQSAAVVTADQLRSFAATRWISTKRTYGSDTSDSERSAAAQSGNFSARSIAW